MWYLVRGRRDRAGTPFSYVSGIGTCTQHEVVVARTTPKRFDWNCSTRKEMNE